MIIGTVRKSSLIDFPGRVSAVVGTQGCNMHCFWCHNAYLIPRTPPRKSPVIETDHFLDFLFERKKLLEGVVITGGEPTIHDDLPNFCREIKALGFAVKLDTNGTNPTILNELMRHDLIDYVAMDVKTDLNQYPQLFRETIDTHCITDSINLLQSSGKPYEFRTTCVTPFVSVDNIDEIGAIINGAPKYYLQRYANPVEDVQTGSYGIPNESDLVELKNRIEPYVVQCEIR